MKWALKKSIYYAEMSALRSVTVTAALRSTGIALHWTGITASVRGTDDIFVQRSWLYICPVFLFVDLIDAAIKPQEILTSPEYESTEYSSLLTKIYWLLYR